MRLSLFIRQEIDLIVTAWEEFARAKLPLSRPLSSLELQNDAKVLLLSIADDIESEQGAAQQQAKARGERPGNSPALTNNARAHAQHRFEQGFTLDEMVAEYRALRASVQRIWVDHALPDDASHPVQLVRFNEAMDQGLSESISNFSKRLEEARDLLLGIAGHDLRNPLGAVMGSAQYLLRTESLEGEQLKAATRILNSAERIHEMVDVLLDFTRTRLGAGLELIPVPGNLGAVCQDVVEELRSFHPNCDLRVQCVGDLDGQWDLHRIEQMVSNLVSNAVQHGAIDQAVIVAVNGKDTRSVAISIHNEGPLIPESLRHVLFEPLKRKQQDERAAHDGSSGLGLGLYIANQIALAHGGHIAVESQEGHGTTFNVSLPRHPSGAGNG